MEHESGLVLSGGGARGAFQAGAVKVLIEKGGYDWKYFTGVSIGALNATMIAQGDIDVLVNTWQNIKSSKDVYKGSIFNLIFKPFRCWIYDHTPLKHIIKSFVNIEKIRDRGKIVEISAVDLETKEIKWFSSEGDENLFIDALLATTTTPIIFEPVLIENKLYIDGGTRDPLPIERMTKFNINNITAILASPLGRYSIKRERHAFIDYFWKKKTCPTLLELIDIVSHVAIDEIVQRTLDKYIYKRINSDFDLEFLFPSKNFVNTIQFEPQRISNAFKAGTEAANILLKNNLKRRL